MPFMLMPILDIFLRESLIPNHQQIFCIPFLGCPGKIEAPSNDDFSINDYDLVVRDGMG
jgi:hypothetical protein